MSEADEMDCDGYRESSASWEDVLMDLTQRGLTQASQAGH